MGKTTTQTPLTMANLRLAEEKLKKEAARQASLTMADLRREEEKLKEKTAKQTPLTMADLRLEEEEAPDDVSPEDIRKSWYGEDSDVTGKTPSPAPVSMNTGSKTISTVGGSGGTGGTGNQNQFNESISLLFRAQDEKAMREAEENTQKGAARYPTLPGASPDWDKITSDLGWDIPSVTSPGFQPGLPKSGNETGISKIGSEPSVPPFTNPGDRIGIYRIGSGTSGNQTDKNQNTASIPQTGGTSGSSGFTSRPNMKLSTGGSDIWSGVYTGGKTAAVPLPNYTGETSGFTYAIGRPDEAVQMEKLSYTRNTGGGTNARPTSTSTDSGAEEQLPPEMRTIQDNLKAYKTLVSDPDPHIAAVEKNNIYPILANYYTSGLSGSKIDSKSVQEALADLDQLLIYCQNRLTYTSTSAAEKTKMKDKIAVIETQADVLRAVEDALKKQPDKPGQNGESGQESNDAVDPYAGNPSYNPESLYGDTDGSVLDDVTLKKIEEVQGKQQDAWDASMLCKKLSYSSDPQVVQLAVELYPLLMDQYDLKKNEANSLLGVAEEFYGTESKSDEENQRALTAVTTGLSKTDSLYSQYEAQLTDTGVSAEEKQEIREKLNDLGTLNRALEARGDEILDALRGHEVTAGESIGYFAESTAATGLGFLEGIGDLTFGGSAWLAQQLTSLIGLTPNQVSDAFGAVAQDYFGNSVTANYMKDIFNRYHPTMARQKIKTYGQAALFMASILSALKGIGAAGESANMLAPGADGLYNAGRGTTAAGKNVQSFLDDLWKAVKGEGKAKSGAESAADDMIGASDEVANAGKTVPGYADEVIEGAGDSLNKLPKTTEESVRTKLDTYLLEPNHPVGGSKAKWFKEALGFTKDNSINLGKQIVFDPKKAVQTAANVHGTKFSQIIPVLGANGKIIDVEFIFIKNNDGVIRLVTSIPTKR